MKGRGGQKRLCRKAFSALFADPSPPATVALRNSNCLNATLAPDLNNKSTEKVHLKVKSSIQPNQLKLKKNNLRSEVMSMNSNVLSN